MAGAARAGVSAAGADSWRQAKCPLCGTKSTFFCAECAVAVGVPNDAVVPTPRMPLDLLVLFRDKKKKATSMHAKVMCPTQVRFLTYPDEMARLGEAIGSPCSSSSRSVLPTTAVLYPSASAVPFAALPLEQLRALRTLVLIDTPWRKASCRVQKDERLAHLPFVKLSDSAPAQSRFWRHHAAGPGCLSSIEALDVAMREYGAARRDAEAAAVAAGEPLAAGDAAHPYWTSAAAASSGAATAAAVGVDAALPSPLLFFFDLVRRRIAYQHATDPALVGIAPGFDAAAKAARVKKLDQKAHGKALRRKAKRQRRAQLDAEVASGASEFGTGWVCYNCRGVGHKQGECPKPCRKCKDPGHRYSTCPLRPTKGEQGGRAPPGAPSGGGGGRAAAAVATAAPAPAIGNA